MYSPAEQFQLRASFGSPLHIYAMAKLKHIETQLSRLPLILDLGKSAFARKRAALSRMQEIIAVPGINAEKKKIRRACKAVKERLNKIEGKGLGRRGGGGRVLRLPEARFDSTALNSASLHDACRFFMRTTGRASAAACSSSPAEPRIRAHKARICIWVGVGGCGGFSRI